MGRPAPGVRSWVGEAGSSILKVYRPGDSHIAQGHPEPVRRFRSRALGGVAAGLIVCRGARAVRGLVTGHLNCTRMPAAPTIKGRM